jgi:tetratricopeptide (TPR) repeat protein
MTARQRTTIIAGACLAVSMTGCVFLVRHIDRLRPQASIEDALYISSPKMVRRASLGFNGLMACIYWTRTVQYFGHRHYDRGQSYNELGPLLEITTTLDPQLFPAYQFGASFLAPKPPNGAGEPARAVQLMEYGIAHNPDNWQIYYNLGFVYYTELKDYTRASEVFAQGSKVPGAHPFMKILAAQMAEHAGDFATARLLWSATFETSNETNIRQNALEHLRAISVDEDVTNLQNAVTHFGRRNGHLPSSMAELVAGEHLPGIPADPDGDAYQLTPEGRIQIEKPDDFPFVTKGLPPGYKPSGLPKFHTKG